MRRLEASTDPRAIGGRRRAEPDGGGRHVPCRHRAVVPSPSQLWGAAKEALAEARLAAEGYRVVARNWRGGGGEIDRVAWDGDVLCFIEVRARSTDSFGPPEMTIDRRKQRLLIRAAAAYLYVARLRPRPMVRFDVVSVVDRKEDRGASVQIIKNAFDANGPL